MEFFEAVGWGKVDAVELEWNEEYEEVHVD